MHRSITAPKVGTPAAEEYYRVHFRIEQYLNWVIWMAGTMDHMSEIARKALISVEENSKEKKKLEKGERTRKKMVDVLKENRQFFLELINNRYIDNYINYLSELLAFIFQQRPETLRSSDQIEIASVLQHDTLEEFIRAEAERRVERLSYKSFGDLMDFFQSRFNLHLFAEEKIPLIVEAIEVRNISVHNRCIINKRFCRRTGVDPSLIGQRRELFIETVDQLAPTLFEGVKKLDASTRTKLHLKGKRYGSLTPSGK